MRGVRKIRGVREGFEGLMDMMGLIARLILGIIFVLNDCDGIAKMRYFLGMWKFCCE